MAFGSIISRQTEGGKVKTVATLLFWALKSLNMVIAAMKLKGTYSLVGKL